MISEVQAPSDLVQIVTLLVPFLTLCATAYIGYKQAQLRDAQTTLANHVNGHMTAMLATKDEIAKLAAEAARALGNAEGAANKKEELRIDDLQKRADAAAGPLVAVAPVAAPVPVTVIANEPVPVKVTK